MITFIPILPEYCGPGLPTCPDGSGDLWWDDASYIRYQTYEPDYRPEQIAYSTDTDNYCNGQVADQEPLAWGMPPPPF